MRRVSKSVKCFASSFCSEDELYFIDMEEDLKDKDQKIKDYLEKGMETKVNCLRHQGNCA